MTTPQQCEHCGTYDNVTLTCDPYEHDVNDKLVEVCLCQACYEERLMEI